MWPASSYSQNIFQQDERRSAHEQEGNHKQGERTVVRGFGSHLGFFKVCASESQTQEPNDDHNSGQKGVLGGVMRRCSDELWKPHTHGFNMTRRTAFGPHEILQQFDHIGR